MPPPLLHLSKTRLPVNVGVLTSICMVSGPKKTIVSTLLTPSTILALLVGGSAIRHWAALVADNDGGNSGREGRQLPGRSDGGNSGARRRLSGRMAAGTRGEKVRKPRRAIPSCHPSILPSFHPSLLPYFYTSILPF